MIHFLYCSINLEKILIETLELEKNKWEEEANKILRFFGESGAIF